MPRLAALRAMILPLAITIALFAGPVAAQDATVDVELGDFYIDMPTTIAAGNITFSMTNVGQMPHTITIEGQGVDVSGDVLQGGQSGSFTVELAAGTYVVYCPIPGHRDAGMELTLTVTGVEAPTPTVPAATATAPATTATPGTGATATADVAPTATSLPDLPQTGSGGVQGTDSGTLGVMLLLVIVAGLAAAGTYRYRSNR